MVPMDISIRIRLSLNKKSKLRCTIARGNSADFNGLEVERILQADNPAPRANFRFHFHTIESPESLFDVVHLQSTIDLEKVVVITGFTEVGPLEVLGLDGRWRREAIT
jgi:3-oxoacyl-ACP reductase-like protein